MKFLDKLSRDEMRTVVGGDGYGGSGNCYNCCESAEMACQSSCGGGSCDYHDCLSQLHYQCFTVLGCAC